MNDKNATDRLNLSSLLFYCPHSSAFLMLYLFLAAISAQAHLTPIQKDILSQPSPPPEEYRFGFDLPSGPQFTEAEKVAQRVRGGEVMPMVMNAFESGADSVRIPPGDYRFGQERWEGAKVIFPLGYENLQRDAAHPFVIDASGATFWFDLDDQQMPPGHRCVGFRNCRNIVLRGAIIDRGTRGCIEGRITRIDREGNRFEIQPSPGVVVPTSYKEHDEQRLFPFKSDGRFCVPLYDMQAGVRKLRYKDITPSEGGRYWVNMLEPQLMERLPAGLEVVSEQQQHVFELRRDGSVFAVKCAAGARGKPVVVDGRMHLLVGGAGEIWEMLLGIIPPGIENGEFHSRL
jgi:hypothetical protein